MFGTGFIYIGLKSSFYQEIRGMTVLNELSLAIDVNHRCLRSCVPDVNLKTANRYDER